MLEEFKLANPGSYIDLASLAPPPPPPEDEGKVIEENEEEPVYHGENVRIMVMQSDVVQLGQLHIVTEIGQFFKDFVKLCKNHMSALRALLRNHVFFGRDSSTFSSDSNFL